MTIQELVREFGEKYRRLIVDAISVLEAQEPTWGLDEPIDKREYIKHMIFKISKIAMPEHDQS